MQRTALPMSVYVSQAVPSLPVGAGWSSQRAVVRLQ